MKSADWPYSVEVIERVDGTKDYFWEIDSHIEQGEDTIIKYHPTNKQYKFAVIEGSFGPDGRKYPVVVDTGASQAVLVKDVHIRQNNLKVETFKTAALGGRKIGLCYLPELDLSSIRLINWPCLRLASQSAGLGVRDDFVIVGLPVLREFKYVAFDNIAGQIEFSKDKVFKPDEADSWEQFPMWLEEDFSGNVFLFARITVEGQEMELQLDTGSGRGLAISEEMWEQIPESKQVRLKHTKELYPYIGNLSCRRGTVAELALGGSKIHNVTVSVFADDSPLVEDCGGLMGMELFRNTKLVIDFENELLWVKRS
jgi:predicted aspartyl protease